MHVNKVQIILDLVLLEASCQYLPKKHLNAFAPSALWKKIEKIIFTIINNDDAILTPTEITYLQNVKLVAASRLNKNSLSYVYKGKFKKLYYLQL